MQGPPSYPGNAGYPAGYPSGYPGDAGYPVGGYPAPQPGYPVGGYPVTGNYLI